MSIIVNADKSAYQIFLDNNTMLHFYRKTEHSYDFVYDMACHLAKGDLIPIDINTIDKSVDNNITQMLSDEVVAFLGMISAAGTFSFNPKSKMRLSIKKNYLQLVKHSFVQTAMEQLGGKANIYENYIYCNAKQFCKNLSNIYGYEYQNASRVLPTIAYSLNCKQRIAFLYGVLFCIYAASNEKATISCGRNEELYRFLYLILLENKLIPSGSISHRADSNNTLFSLLMYQSSSINLCNQMMHSSLDKAIQLMTEYNAPEHTNNHIYNFLSFNNHIYQLNRIIGINNSDSHVHISNSDNTGFMSNLLITDYIKNPMYNTINRSDGRIRERIDQRHIQACEVKTIRKEINSIDSDNMALGFSPNNIFAYKNGFFDKLPFTYSDIVNQKLICFHTYYLGSFAVSPKIKILSRTGQYQTKYNMKMDFTDITPVTIDEFSWKPAKTVNEGDWICVPASIMSGIYSNKSTEIIDLSNYIKYMKAPRNYEIHDDIIIWNARGNRKSFNRFIDIYSNDFLYLLGFYIADGSVHNGCLQYSLNRMEPWQLKKINQAMLSIFGDELAFFDTKQNSKNSLFISYSYPLIAYLFKNLIPWTLYEKQIPERYQFLTGEKSKKLLEGLIDGDGCIKNGRVEYVSASKQLTQQVRTLLLINNSPTRFYRQQYDNSYRNGRDSWHASGTLSAFIKSIYPNSSSVNRNAQITYTMLNEGYLAARIRNISIENTQAFSIDSNDTFSTGTCCLSTCDQPSIDNILDKNYNNIRKKETNYIKLWQNKIVPRLI